MSAGGYGITQQDMEASRLVFVSAKDAKPRRKVAVPLPDGLSWQQFLQQVQTKLKLPGVESIYLASSGERVTQLDDLQDIDELIVVGKAGMANGTGSLSDLTAANGSAGAGPSGMHHANGDHTAVSMAGAASIMQDRHPIAAADIASASTFRDDEDGGADGANKYVKRSNALKRALQSVFPSMFTPAPGSLPVTTKDVAGRESSADGGGGSMSRGPRRRSRAGGRRGGGLLGVRVVLLILLVVCGMGAVLFMFLRAMRMPEVQPH